MKKWETFSDEELAEKVAHCKSYRELAKSLGYYADSGSAISTVKEMVKLKGFNVDHFLGQSWNKNQFDYSRFQYGSNIKPANALAAITAIRGYKCECCGISKWQGESLTLEIHHKDGDHLNNILDNLQVLCPNCHSQTKNYKKKNTRKNCTEEEYRQALESNPNIRQALLSLGLNGSGGNYKKAYEVAFKYNIEHIIKNCQ